MKNKPTNTNRTNIARLVAPFSLALVLIGCVRTVTLPPPPNDVRPMLPGFVLFRDNAGGVKDVRRIVVKDATLWDQIWREATSQQTDPAPLPQINFGTEMVVLVAAGRMRPGDLIRVDSAGTRDGRFVAVVQTVTACPRIEAASFPLQIVRVIRSDLPVEFKELPAIQGPNCMDWP